MKYLVRYTETNVIEREIEAESKDKAEKKMMEMICSDKIDLSFAELVDSKCEVVDDKDEKTFKTKLEWVDVKTIQEFLTDYDLFAPQRRESIANDIAKWICDTLNEEPEFPWTMFEKYEMHVGDCYRYYVHVLFDRGMSHGTVTLMPDMYGIVPENSPSYVVLDRDLDEDGYYLEEDDAKGGAK